MPGIGAAKRGNAAGTAAARRTRLAERRKALGLTQEALADLMGVDPSTVVRWERGQSAPLALIRPKLATALRVSAEQLGELLAQDPADPGPPAAERTGVPRQLPAAVAGFTGRTAELAALTKLLDSADAGAPGTVVISAIGGTAGVGKTALAITWGHQAADRFPDGQLYVNLRGYDPDRPVPPADALAGFLRGLGVGGQDIPPEEDERAARYRSLLAGRRILVVLDNAGSAEQARPLLPGSPTCSVVVTSRDSLTGLVARDGAARLDLDLLPLPDAVRLLNELIGDRAAVDPDATEALARWCCRLPLALRVAAELAAARPGVPLADLAGELAEQQERLDLLDAGGDPRTAVRAVFSWSHRHLDPGTARAFRLAGLHPAADFDAYAVAALADTTVGQARRTLDALAEAHLVQPAGAAGPGRYAMHDLLRAYAAELAATHDGDDGRHAALTRLLDHYLGTAAAAMDALNPAERNRRPRVDPPGTPAPPLPDTAVARAWLDAERAALTAVIRLAATRGWPGHAIGLSDTLWRYLESGGHHPEAILIHASALLAARQQGNRTAEGTAMHALGTIDMHQGRYPQATERFAAARNLSRKAGNRLGEARALGMLGAIHYEQGRYQQATGCYEQALSACRRIGDPAGEAVALGNLGLIMGRQGRYQQASRLLRRSVGICRETGHSQQEAFALASLGEVAVLGGDHEQAEDILRQSLRLCRAGGNRQNESLALTIMGDLCRRQGRPEAAADRLRQALAICRELGDRAGEAKALNSLGEVHLATDQPGDACDRHAAALGLATEIGDRLGQGHAHDGLGNACHALGDPGEAGRHWREALAIYAALGVPEAARVRARLDGADLPDCRSGGADEFSCSDGSSWVTLATAGGAGWLPWQQGSAGSAWCACRRPTRTRRSRSTSRSASRSARTYRSAATTAGWRSTRRRGRPGSRWRRRSRGPRSRRATPG